MYKDTYNLIKKRMRTWRMQSSIRDRSHVKRVDCKYKLTGFRINFFKKDFSVYYFKFVFVYLGQSTVAIQGNRTSISYGE